MSERTGRSSWLRDHALGVFFGVLFLLALVGQALSGAAEYNQELQTAGVQTVSLAQYLVSSDFAVDVAENWQSEYLQFLLYILATVWLVHRGSPESKQEGEQGLGSDEEQLVGAHAEPSSPRWARAGGWRTGLYSHSLALVMGAVFLLSWFAQSVAGWATYDEQQLADRQAPVSWAAYAVSPDFWNRTLQNWQSEFLAVGSMVVLSVYLRERGSPESKPVGAAHGATADTG